MITFITFLFHMFVAFCYFGGALIIAGAMVIVVAYTYQWMIQFCERKVLGKSEENKRN